VIRTVLKMRVREGCEGAFEHAWAEAAPKIREYAGLLGQSLLRESDQPRTYLIMADWDSHAHLQAFEHSPVRRALSAALTPLREAAQKTVLDDVGEHAGQSRRDT
jgi:heme-degrading monooxygenase HmoA